MMGIKERRATLYEVDEDYFEVPTEGELVEDIDAEQQVV